MTGSTERPVEPQSESGVEVEAPGEWSFDHLYRSQYSRMVAPARLMLGGLPAAEEIAQEAFVQLYRNRSSIDYPLAYLRIAVVNGCRSQGRRRAVERRHCLLPGGEPVVVDTDAIAPWLR